MLLTLEQIKAIDPEGTWLEITPTDIEQAQPNPQLYANPTGLHNARLNRLCMNKFQTWLTAGEIANQSSFTETELPAMWDMVIGVAIDIGKTRVILVPTELLDRSELRVPQEWIDLPNWLGDYYLGVQIDLESNLINFWGFTSHQSLKEKGEYSPLDRTYSLDSDFLVSNLDLLWLAEELELSERTTVDELPNLDLNAAVELIKQLSIPSPYSPRFNIEFPSWGAILNSPSFRSDLYQTRLRKTAQAQAPKPSLRWFDWLRQEFIEARDGWRDDLVLQGRTRNQPTSAIERAKLIDLQLNFRQKTVVLLVIIIPDPENDEQVCISVRVYPEAGYSYIPPQLELSCLDEDGIAIDGGVVESGINENFIEIEFTCDVGTAFNIQLKLSGDRVVERFVS